MTLLLRLFAALLLALPPLPALAQNFGQIPPHTFLGNPDPATPKTAAPVIPSIARDSIANGGNFSWRTPTDYVSTACTGGDDTAALADAAADLTVVGSGTLYLPSGKACTTTSLNIIHSYIGIACMPEGGVSRSRQATSLPPGCRIKYIGPNGGTVVAFTASVSPGLLGNFMDGVQIDCNNGAGADALQITSSFGFVGRNVGLINCAGGDHLSFKSLASQSLNMQGAHFENLYIAAGTLNSNGIRLSCDGKHNNTTPYCSSYNVFINTEIVLNGTGNTAEGIVFEGGANNTFIGGRIFIANPATPGVDFSIFDNGYGPAEQQPAGGNVVLHVFTNGSVVARGQTSHPGCTSFYSGNAPLPLCTRYNTFAYGELSNGGTQSPTIEPGAQMYFHLNDGETTGIIATGNGAGGQPGILAMPGHGFLHNCQNNAVARSKVNVNNPPTAYWCGAQNMPLQFFDASQDSYFAQITGTTSLGLPQVTDIPDTSLLLAGDQIAGGGIPAQATILSVDSPTQITMTANAVSSNVGETLAINRGDVVHWQWTGSPAQQRTFELVQDSGTGGVKLPPNSQVPNGKFDNPTFTGTVSVPLGAGVVASDVSFNHDTSFSHVLNDLSAAVTSGHTYICRGHLFTMSGATGGIKLSFDGRGAGGAGSSSLRITTKAFNGVALVGSTQSTTNISDGAGPILIATTNIVTDIEVDGSLTVDVDGNWVMKVGQNVDDPSTTTVFKQSYMACQQAS